MSDIQGNIQPKRRLPSAVVNMNEGVVYDSIDKAVEHMVNRGEFIVVSFNPDVQEGVQSKKYFGCSWESKDEYLTCTKTAGSVQEVLDDLKELVLREREEYGIFTSEDAWEVDQKINKNPALLTPRDICIISSILSMFFGEKPQ